MVHVNTGTRDNTRKAIVPMFTTMRTVKLTYLVNYVWKNYAIKGIAKLVGNLAIQKEIQKIE